MTQHNFTALERFLRGDISLQDLRDRSRYNNLDRVFVAFSLIVTTRSSIVEDDWSRVLSSLQAEFMRFFPYSVNEQHDFSGNMMAVSRRHEFHASIGRGCIGVELRIPERAIWLIKRYADSVDGGIARTRKMLAEQMTHDRAEKIVADILKYETPEVIALVKKKLANS